MNHVLVRLVPVLQYEWIIISRNSKMRVKDKNSTAEGTAPTFSDLLRYFRLIGHGSHGQHARCMRPRWLPCRKNRDGFGPSKCSIPIPIPHRLPGRPRQHYAWIHAHLSCDTKWVYLFRGLQILLSDTTLRTLATGGCCTLSRMQSLVTIFEVFVEGSSFSF